MSDDALQKSDFLLYTAPDGSVRIEVFYAEQTVWLTQSKMAELFGVDRTVITKHVQNIFESGELEEINNVQKLHVAHSTKPVSYYNLDVIISVGYRVNSERATKFRQWATTTLRDFMIKGYALDKDRFIHGSHFGEDYFEQLLEEIREIRASERMFYRKITDIYATAVDYQKDAPVTQEFFKTVQNKLHYAVHGQTAAELIAGRANAKKPHMGLTNWRKGPQGKVLKSDVTVAKNYLDPKNLRLLERIVTLYLDFAELQATRRVHMTMADWAKRLDGFLKFNELELLDNPGTISHEVASCLAEKEYKKYRLIQDKAFESDFDQAVKKLSKEQS